MPVDLFHFHVPWYDNYKIDFQKISNIDLNQEHEILQHDYLLHIQKYDQ